jgi:hypothetical protein
VPTNEKAGLAGPNRPLGSPEIPQFYLPAGVDKGVYTPRLYGVAVIQFGGSRRKIKETRRSAFLLPIEAGAKTVDWDGARQTEIMPDQLLQAPPKSASYLPLPAGAMELKTFTRWVKNFDRWLARTQKLAVSPKTEGAEEVTIGPKRGGVSVELVGIAWELA